jgi:hypothetical protein
MRRAARSLMVTAVVMGEVSDGGRHIQIIWYPAYSIVKCAGHRNQTFKG